MDTEKIREGIDRILHHAIRKPEVRTFFVKDIMDYLHEEGSQYVNGIILIDEDGASRQEVNVIRDPDGVY